LQHVFVVPPKDFEIQLIDNGCAAVHCITSFPKSWVTGTLQEPTVAAGCIALPSWLRRSFFLGDDLIGHRLTVTYVQVFELPVATRVTLQCVAKVPPTLPDFYSPQPKTSLSNPLVVLKEHMQSRHFKALTAGLRFSVFYCSKDGGGCWDFEVSSIKQRRNSSIQNATPFATDEVSEGCAGCVFSNCENLGSHEFEFDLLPDVPVSQSASTLQTSQLHDMSENFADFKLPTLVFSSAPCSALQFHVLQNFETIFQLKPDAVAFAPGRLEFLGNHLDYNCGPVLGLAINKGVTACAALQTASSSKPSITISTSQTAPPIGDGAKPPPQIFVFFDDLHEQCDKSSRTIPDWAVYTVCVCR
jgi:hypothetical protein